ncbi:MAG: response regulator [Nitrospirae bacterium]|nr:response regulator [Nitrospirota bacterium]
MNQVDNLNKKKILIADDEELIVWSLRKYFEADGYHVDMVHNGSDALKSLKSNAYNIIVTDLFMPDMSGMEVLIKMKESGIRIPVIITSAYFSEKIMSDIMNEGAFKCINKPFQMEDVLGAIKEAEQFSFNL